MSLAATPGPPRGPAPGPGRYSIYTGRAANWSVILATAAFLVPLLVLGKPSDGSWLDLALPALILAVVVLLFLLTCSSIRTTAGPGGVSVYFGVLGLPRRTYPLERIERAEVIDLRFWYVAGGFWWTPRCTSYTLRSGATLRLVLRGGHTVLVTVPDPRAAVDAVEEARAARG